MLFFKQVVISSQRLPLVVVSLGWQPSKTHPKQARFVRSVHVLLMIVFSSVNNKKKKKSVSEKLRDHKQGPAKLENFCQGLIETIMEIDNYNKTINHDYDH
jgi:hypothetical protein